MVTDQQVRRLFLMKNTEKNIEIAAAKSGMSEKSARKYLTSGKLPSQMKKPHTWKTRKDSFEDIWDEVTEYLENNSGLEAKTLFEHFQKTYPDKFQDGQLRTLQRKIKEWRAMDGPPKEVFFAQNHYPGRLSESDFTNMNKLNITINKEEFKHLIFHFVLTYSNWETGTICYSESFENLSTGLQNALWKLGCVPKIHQTDNLTAAIYKECNKKEFTVRYKTLLNHYDLIGKSIQAGHGNENGDIEQRHNRFKKAVEQALMLRGSYDFLSIEEYQNFLNKIFDQLNSGRQKKFLEELKILKPLPKIRIDDFKEFKLTVGPGSTIQVAHNTYSVDSKLIKEDIKVRLKADSIEIYYGNKKADEFPRVRGEKKHFIQYRHIIDTLIRKPGAFENYRYREDLFPSTNFRMAYDYFRRINSNNASKKYLKILHLAAKEGENKVDNALRLLFNKEKDISLDAVKKIVLSDNPVSLKTEVTVLEVELKAYDELYENQEVLHG